MAENGNGEVKQLAGVKRAYRGKVASLEADLRAKFEADLADGKKRLKNEYLEAVVDVVFADDARPVEVAPKVTETIEAKSDPTKCPECGAPIDPMDKFCSECAYPLREEIATTGEDPRANLLGVAGHSRRITRRRPR